VGSGSAPGEFRVDSGWFPGPPSRVVSGSAPGRHRISSGSTPYGFRVGSSWFRVKL
jgi:hypothetical protein